MGRPLLKICGIRDRDTYLLCRDLGVDFVGFNFSPASPRKITRAEGEQLFSGLDPKGPKVVFLFYQNTRAEVSQALELYSPDFVQVLSEEWENADWQTALAGRALLPSLRIQKPVEGPLPFSDLPLVILDSFKKGAGGGTGEAFPWEYVSTVKRPYLLAGGINPENVKQAFGVLKPAGFDTASGVETDGKKDPEKIKLLVQNVRSL